MMHVQYTVHLNGRKFVRIAQPYIYYPGVIYSRPFKLLWQKAPGEQALLDPAPKTKMAYLGIQEYRTFDTDYAFMKFKKR